MRQRIVTVTSSSTGYKQPAAIDQIEEKLDFKLGLVAGAGLHSPEEFARRVIPVVEDNLDLAPVVREAVRRQSSDWKQAWNEYVARKRVIQRTKYHAWYLKV